MQWTLLMPVLGTTATLVVGHVDVQPVLGRCCNDVTVQVEAQLEGVTVRLWSAACRSRSRTTASRCPRVPPARPL